MPSMRRTISTTFRGESMTIEAQGQDLFHREATTDLRCRVRGEYLEMPGLRLSVDQASRLWALERAFCQEVLDALVGADFLQRDRDGRYRLKTCGY
jgi:hypothetical protein